MKNILILTLVVFFLAPGLFSQDLTGKNIIEKVNDLINVS